MAAATTSSTSSPPPPDDAFDISLRLRLRRIHEEDFSKALLPLLSQLTDVGEVSEAFFRRTLASMQAQQVESYVIEDVTPATGLGHDAGGRGRTSPPPPRTGRLIAFGSILVERKFIHGGGAAGHIEDVVVDRALRHKGLGRRLVAKLVDVAKQAGAYKVILDTRERNVQFYESCGFKRKDVQMALYFDARARQQSVMDLMAFAAASPTTAAVSASAADAAAAAAAPHVPRPPPLMTGGMVGATKPQPREGVVLRELRESDFGKGFLALLAQLTKVGELRQQQFESVLARIRASGQGHMFVVEGALPGDPEEKKQLIGAATLLIEPKLVHACGLCAHVEDVVVDKRSRGMGLGKLLIQHCCHVAFISGCYKLVLDCKEANVGFYERCGLSRNEVCMAKYFGE